MPKNKEILEDGTFILNEPVKLPEVLDVLIVGGGPGGTAAAFRAKELGLSALVIDIDDLMKRIRDYAKDKLLLPGFGGADKMRFPKGDKLIPLLHFSPIDKDEMFGKWKNYYRENNIPAKVGVELTGLEPGKDGIWQTKNWNHNTKSEEIILAKHIVLSVGSGMPRRFDIPGNTEGIAYRLSDPDNYVSAPVCVIGGGTSAAEAVIAISNAKAEANVKTEVFWSHRGDKMPLVSKALADVFFDAFVGNGNICNLPHSEPNAIVTSEDRKEYLSVRIDRKVIPGRPNESAHLEFPKENCITCIGQEIPERFLNSIGIYMATGTDNKKRMIVTPLLETQQPNVYLIGDILSKAYFETDDFDSDPASFRKIKHLGNIKSAVTDGVKVVEVIAQKLAGKDEIHVELEFVEEEKKVEEAKEAISKPVAVVDSEGPPKESVEPARIEEEHPAYLIRVLQDDVDEDHYPLLKNQVATIGRKECDINFPDDTMLSDKHASVSHGPDGYFLRDDGSANGVFLRAPEGRYIKAEPGNLLRVGRQFLLIRKENGGYGFVHYDQTGKEIGRYTLPEKTIVVGRQSPGITLQKNDMTLSRSHLAMSVKEEGLFIKDLRSMNGSYLKVKNAVKLEDGDQFRVGRQTLRLSLEEEKVRPDVHFSIISKASIVTEKPTEQPEAGLAERPAEPKISSEPTPKRDMAVTFKNEGKSFPIAPGQSICEIAEKNDVDIEADCHAGGCGRDPIRIISGKENLNEMDDEERDTLEDICDLDPNQYRLACVSRPKGAVEVEILKQK